MEHIKYVTAGQLTYYKRKDSTRLVLKKFRCIVVDGADRPGFGLPHFVSTNKDDSGHAL